MMKRTRKVAVVAAVWLGLVGGLPALAHAEAIAQSILEISNFTISASDPTQVQIITAANSGNVFANYNGSIAAQTAFPALADINLSVCQGPDCAAYSPGTELGSPPVADFSGSTATLTGSAVVPGGAQALTDNTVALESGGVGSAISNLGLVSTFTIIVGGGGTVLTFEFEADPYLIVSIVDPQVGTANAQIAWSLTLAGPNPALWAPDGIAGNAIGITETSDPCSLNTNVGVLGAGTQTTVYNPACAGFFEGTIALAEGTHTLTITHTGNATAVALVPAPSSLLILGLGLGSAGWLSRRWIRRA